MSGTWTDTLGDAGPFSGTRVKPPKLATITVGDVRIDEPKANKTATASFRVTLDKPSAKAVTVHYATRDGSGPTAAKAGKDYKAKSGSLTFAPGKTDKVVQVEVKHDPSFKGSAKRFSLVLSSPSNAELAKAVGVGTITRRRVTIDSVSPNKGSPAGGTPITVKGLGFGSPGARADVVLCPHNARPIGPGGSACEQANSVVVHSDHTITAVTPPMSGRIRDAGRAANVYVLVPTSGTLVFLASENSSVFTYRLRITSVSPNKGSPAGGTPITVKGLGFGSPGARADVVLCPHNARPIGPGGSACEQANSVVVHSDHTITAVTPPMSGRIRDAGRAANVYVLVPTSGTLVFLASENSSVFTYRLRITSVSPNKGSPAGGTPITVKGLGFGSPGARADVVLCPHNARPIGPGGSACEQANSVVVHSDHTITAVTPPMSGRIRDAGRAANVYVLVPTSGTLVFLASENSSVFTYR